MLLPESNNSKIYYTFEKISYFYARFFEPSNIKNKYIILFKENNVFAIVLFFLVSIIEK